MQKLIISFYSTNILYDADHTSDINFLSFLKIMATGNDGEIVSKLPQLLVFGSGEEDPGWGSKADPNRAIIILDYKAFDKLMGLITLGMKLPDLRGSDPKKIPELIDKMRKLELYRLENKVEQCESCKAFKKDGKPFDTAGKNINTNDIKQIPINEFHLQ